MRKKLKGRDATIANMKKKEEEKERGKKYIGPSYQKCKNVWGKSIENGRRRILN